MSEYTDMQPLYWTFVDQYQATLTQIQELTMWAEHDESEAKRTMPEVSKRLMARAQETRAEIAILEAKLETLKPKGGTA